MNFFTLLGNSNFVPLWPLSSPFVKTFRLLPNEFLHACLPYMSFSPIHPLPQCHLSVPLLNVLLYPHEPLKLVTFLRPLVLGCSNRSKLLTLLLVLSGGSRAVGGGQLALHEAGLGLVPLAGHVPHLLQPHHSVLDEY